MKMTFTVIHDLDINIDGMLKNINQYINDVIADYLSRDNTVVEYFSEKDTDRLLSEVSPKVRKIVLDKLA